MVTKNNLVKVKSSELNRFVPITPHSNICKECHKQASILYNNKCPRCLNDRVYEITNTTNLICATCGNNFQSNSINKPPTNNSEG